jgi:hypothetical protein
MNGPFTTDDESGTSDPLTRSLSPSEGERVPAGRVRGIFTVEGWGEGLLPNLRDIFIRFLKLESNNA